jgi:hypothetical protein
MWLLAVLHDGRTAVVDAVDPIKPSEKSGGTTVSVILRLKYNRTAIEARYGNDGKGRSPHILPARCVFVEAASA